MADFTQGLDKLAVEGFGWDSSNITYSNDNKTVSLDLDDDDSVDSKINFASAVQLTGDDFLFG